MYERSVALRHVILAVVALAVSGCASVDSERASEGSGEGEFTVEELSAAASPALAYIETPHGQGSGFVISPDGLVVTNFHVLLGADEATVALGATSFSDITVVAASKAYDIAVLKVPGSDLASLDLAGGLREVTLGEQIVAMGNPHGLRGTVSHGLVSTVERELPGVDFSLIQTTAPISRGSSGGPLLNMQGDVIGINTLIHDDGQNLNFAVPVDLVHELVEQRGSGQSLSAVFGSGSGAYYQHATGELSVALSWEGAVDLDLEVWNEDFEYLGDSYGLGPGWDMTSGGQGEEYFVFRNHAEADVTGEHEVPRDFGDGRYIVSPFYYSGSERIASASLTVHYPDGSTEDLDGDIAEQSPWDQWFALLVDVDDTEVKLMDFFASSETIVLLEWDTGADLDLLVWDHEVGEYFHPSHFGGHDVMDGTVGVEVFAFDRYADNDFSRGHMDVDVKMQEPGNPETRATVTLIQGGGVRERFAHTFTADPEGRDYVWQVMGALDPQTGEYVTPDVTRLYE